MEPMTDEQRYAAIRARDTRFDGMFFTCVRSTGIFCRPSCPARTPRRDGVEFVPSAAAALLAGYRACKRCGPTAPPGSPDDDPAGSLAGRALSLIEAGTLDGGHGVTGLAARLAVSERTLHRALLARTGGGALTHARMRRARRAHDLVVGSDLPLGIIAHAAGFGSERQFHDTFRAVFGHAPSVVRARSGLPATVAGGRSGAAVTVRLSVRRPFDSAGLLAWFTHRAIPGVEEVEGSRWTRAVRLPHGPGVVQVDLGAEGPLPLTLRLHDLRDHAAATALVRRLLDLDADPLGIDAGLSAAMQALTPLVESRPGIRLPGVTDIPEALLWAIVGQQITTAQAREQLTRATDLDEEPLPSSLRTDGVTRLPVEPARAAASAQAWFRGPRARRDALRSALAPGAAAGTAAEPGRDQGTAGPPGPGAGLDPALPVDRLRRSLLALRGVGPWTADYVLLRSVRAIDVAPTRDAALLIAAKDLGIAADHAALSRALEDASPWRSYACLHLWHHQATLRADVYDPTSPARSSTRTGTSR